MSVTLSDYQDTDIEKSFSEYHDDLLKGFRQGLVKKRITDKTGKVTTVWVRPEGDVKGGSKFKKPENQKKKFSVVFRGGSIGETKSSDTIDGMPIQKTFDTKEEAETYAKRRNKRLSQGEKAYYKMKYLVR